MLWIVEYTIGNEPHRTGVMTENEVRAGVLVMKAHPDAELQSMTEEEVIVDDYYYQAIDR